MKASPSYLEFLVTGAVESLSEDDPDIFFSVQQINQQIEIGKDYDSDNIKRGRLARNSNQEIQQILDSISGKQLEGYASGCSIEKTPNGYRFIEGEHDER